MKTAYKRLNRDHRIELEFLVVSCVKDSSGSPFYFFLKIKRL